MIDSFLDNLPALKDFKELKKGDRVYSKQFGVGEVHSLYTRDEIIVQFSVLRKRLSAYDGICKIPENYLQPQGNSKVQVVCDGKNMSFAEFKKKNKVERQRVRLEKKLLKEEQKSKNARDRIRRGQVSD